MIKKIKLNWLVCFLVGTLISFSTFSQVDSSLGTKHNQILNYLENTYDFTGKDSSEFMEDMFRYVVPMFDSTYSIDNIEGGFWGQFWACVQGEPREIASYKTYRQLLTILVDDGKISSGSRALIDSLVCRTHEIEDYDDFLTIYNNSLTQLGTFEISTGEDSLMRGFLSVYQKSAEHWSNYYDDDEAGLLSDSLSVPIYERFSLRFRCFICVASRDLFGALIGFAAGNCICTKLGITNPKVCGAIGAALFGTIYSIAAKGCEGVCKRCPKPQNPLPNWMCNLPFLYW